MTGSTTIPPSQPLYVREAGHERPTNAAQDTDHALNAVLETRLDDHLDRLRTGRQTLPTALRRAFTPDQLDRLQTRVLSVADIKDRTWSLLATALHSALVDVPDPLEPEQDQHTQLRNALTAAETERDELLTELTDADNVATRYAEATRTFAGHLTEIALATRSNLLDLNALPDTIAQLYAAHERLRLAAGALVAAANGAYEFGGAQVLDRVARAVHALLDRAPVASVPHVARENEGGAGV